MTNMPLKTLIFAHLATSRLQYFSNSRGSSSSLHQIQHHTHHCSSFNAVKMNRIEQSNGKFNGVIAEEENDNEERPSSSNSIFEEMKQLNIQLLELLQNPNRNRSTPSLLLQLLRRSPPLALQPMFDYTLFPLLLIFDAAINSRSSPKVDSKGTSINFDTPEPPIEVSDAVAEGVLCCLEELLKKCCLGSVDQMIVILKKLASGTLLSPLEASEEFRQAVIRCFKVLLLNLHACSDESCPCKQIVSGPMLLPKEDLHSQLPKVFTYNSGSEECLLAFLQSDSASAAIGHWLSLLLKAADVETARGHRGSASLRVEAFSTLRVLVAKVGNSDALAFFLPGVVSQIGKVLHVSKTMISGAAGSTEALDQAIRCLAEFLVIVLNDDSNISILSTPDVHPRKDKSIVSVLEELRQLPHKGENQGEFIVKDNEAVDRVNPVSASKEKGNTNGNNRPRALRVTRTEDWIANTSVNVDKLLSATFPRLCLHPSKKVRGGILEAIKALLSHCSGALKKSRLMFLECLCVLVCDDSEDVSSVAQVFLQYFLSSSEKQFIEQDVAEIFTRLVEKLPKMVLGDEESLAVAHVHKLLVLIYFAGPQLLANHLLQSPVTAARFLDLFALCLSQKSVFSGSLDKLVVTRSSSGYMHSIAEMRAIKNFNSEGLEFFDARNRKLVQTADDSQRGCELPHMPPWFVQIGSKKLYEALAGILRLVGLSVFSDSRGEGSLALITEIPLGYIRNIVSEVRRKEYHKESWQSWYSKTGSGQLVRQASTAVCILNEMIFGLSDQAITSFTRLFQKTEDYDPHKDYKFCKTEQIIPDVNVWKTCQKRGARSHLIECIGNILHEYLSSEVWVLPVENTITPGNEDIEMPLHFFHDNATLHQVIIDGIGIFNICLGKEFSSSGFLHSSLFKLLETLICSNFQIKSASDAVLNVISITHGYSRVGHLVLANSDYIIDSICRQLRHLDLNPHIPNVLAALLSCIGVANKILPLLEEPMRAVSVELEILGRHQHPDLTIPFLKAVAEIAKTSKHEACGLPNQLESYSKDAKSKLSAIEKKTKKQPGWSESSVDSYIDMDSMESEEDTDIHANGADTEVELWESILFKLNDSKRYRRTVGSLVGSCLIAATPLVASANQRACIIALDIIEDGLLALAKVEEAHKHEKVAKEAIERVFHLCSFHHLMNNLDAADDESVENRLLPAMNKIWPFLIACVRQKNPAAVRRCSTVISNVVQICGGDFFSRRFHSDGIHFWKLLSTSPLQKKPISKQERTSLQLPYRSNSASSDVSFAEVSDLKVQAAVLNMIADLARDKRSASALEAILKKVSGIVVGIACSGVTGLHEASINALKGLASIDPDLIWLLLADVYYSLKNQQKQRAPTPEFPEIYQILPPPSSSKGYLYVMYGGQSYGFDIQFSSVENVFKTLHSQVFTSQDVQLT